MTTKSILMLILIGLTPNISAQEIEYLEIKTSVGVSLEFTSVEGKFYNIQQTNDLAPENYNDSPSSIPGTGEIISRFIASEPSKNFFRVIESDSPHARLESAATNALPAGSIIAFAGPLTPAGFLKCNGQSLDSSLFPELFSMIEEFWGDGGDGPGGRFSIPDLRSRTIIGATTPLSSPASNLTLRSLTETGGEERVQLTEAEMPAHSHGSKFSSGNDTDSTGTDSVPASFTFAASSNRGLRTTASSADRVATEEIEESGGDQAHNNMPPFAAAFYIIKL